MAHGSSNSTPTYILSSNPRTIKKENFCSSKDTINREKKNRRGKAFVSLISDKGLRPQCAKSSCNSTTGKANYPLNGQQT
jgi:hypothetical protein